MNLQRQLQTVPVTDGVSFVADAGLEGNGGLSNGGIIAVAGAAGLGLESPGTVLSQTNPNHSHNADFNSASASGFSVEHSKHLTAQVQVQAQQAQIQAQTHSLIQSSSQSSQPELLLSHTSPPPAPCSFVRNLYK
ncbi:hypothetical protein HK100_008860 [Physocladia obscura]|uniref:Uncharacterized protein n=1 Tax=Physocladia obscura TaxID=109957 RepID=A0AAD5T9Z7_9FUNG|nr:hypothetical protein HK100_008860 [Physocladia obscura]